MPFHKESISNIVYTYATYIFREVHILFTDVQTVDKIDVKCFLLESIFHTTGRDRYFLSMTCHTSKEFPVIDFLVACRIFEQSHKSKCLFKARDASLGPIDLPSIRYSLVGNRLNADYFKVLVKVLLQSQGCQAGSILQRLSGLQAAATS